MQDTLSIFTHSSVGQDYFLKGLYYCFTDFLGIRFLIQHTEHSKNIIIEPQTYFWVSLMFGPLKHHFVILNDITRGPWAISLTGATVPHN